jgi:hypothetical protein
MRENCTYGSEGGEAKSLPYPYHRRFGFQFSNSRHMFALAGDARAPR